MKSAPPVCDICGEPARNTTLFQPMGLLAKEAAIGPMILLPGFTYVHDNFFR
jgi:hypothetical protein